MNTKNLLLSSLILATSVLSQVAHAQHSLGLGVKLLGSTWKGDNVDSVTDFESTTGNQFGFNLVYQYNRFYTGFNFQGGEYKFKDSAPDKIIAIGKVPSEDVKIDRGEGDILVGYYFWPQVSLFLDLKSITSEWKDDNPLTQKYATQFVGLGFGVSGYIPLSDSWMLFGSFGVVPNGTIKQIKGSYSGDIGNGDSGALEFGAIYHFNRNNRLNFGLKSQWQTYEFDNLARSEQKHQVGSLFIGYNYLFLFE
ncbi:MAG: hypothetical protein AMJ53_05550 [Gammaproteobacteria bacterium SG8_11]|nr:MAG: hypothetical protein AMJ53_05550 [Gammaproteobacteria bacterium SG8_11]